MIFAAIFPSRWQNFFQLWMSNTIAHPKSSGKSSATEVERQLRRAARYPAKAWEIRRALWKYLATFARYYYEEKKNLAW
jgi:hypothetical protein